MNNKSDQPQHVGETFMLKSDFWNTFKHSVERVNGINIHYVEGGEGPVVVLIPGWPQSWYAWRYVMVQLVEKGYRVIAVDPKGMGDSDAPKGQYDLTTVSTELHHFAEQLGLLDQGPINIVGHDVGSWIAYAWAADWRDDIKTLAIFDALIPGLSVSRNDLSKKEANIRGWHFAFNQLDDLPQLLIRGREVEFLTWLFRSKAVHAWTITDEDIAIYAKYLALPGVLSATTSYYQEALSDEGIQANINRAQDKLSIPVLAVGAEHSVSDRIIEAAHLFAKDVSGHVVLNSGHYLPEEAPNKTAELLVDFLAN